MKTHLGKTQIYHEKMFTLVQFRFQVHIRRVILLLSSLRPRQHNLVLARSHQERDFKTSQNDAGQTLNNLSLTSLTRRHVQHNLVLDIISREHSPGVRERRLWMTALRDSCAARNPSLDAFCRSFLSLRSRKLSTFLRTSSSSPC